MLSKKEIEQKLIKKYGPNFKTPLARDLKMDVSAVRKMFNNNEELRPINQIAILCILDH